MSLKVRCVKTLWGVTPSMGNCPSGYSALFKRIKAEGFAAIETPVWKVEDKPAFVAALAEHGMSYIAMVNTCTPDDRPGAACGSVAPVFAQTLEAHIASFKAQVAQALTMKPLLINAHSGCDCWPAATARAFFEAALAVEAEAGIVICHETHRGRVLYNPWATRDLCAAFPSLKLTADLSHFCVVAERVFPETDADWADVMTHIARHTRHIHARVGYAEGPQVREGVGGRGGVTVALIFKKGKRALQAHAGVCDS